jgi:hypothetical protein
MQLQRRLQANLEAHKSYMKGQIDVHKTIIRGNSGMNTSNSNQSGRFSHEIDPDLLESKSPADMHATHASHPRGSSPLRQELGDASTAQRAPGDQAAHGYLAGMHAADADVHILSREASGTAPVVPVVPVHATDFPEGKHLHKDGLQGSLGDHATDPLMSMHDFGGGIQDGMPVGLVEEQGGNTVGDLHMPMTMPEWNDGHGALGEVEYGDLFEFPDSNGALLEPTFSDQEPAR